MEKVKSFFSNLFDRSKKFAGTPSGESFVGAIMSILVGILFGFILMLIFGGVDALYGIFIIFTGGISGGLESIGEVLKIAAPIIITGLSVGFAFKTGLFNIGATGQMTVGAFAAVYVGVHWTFLPGFTHWIVAVLVAILAGAFWGFIPGLLKALFNVHEVVATIMLNYIGMYLVSYGVQNYVWNPDRSESLSVAPNAAIPDWGLRTIFPDSSLTWGIFLAIIAVIVIYIILEKTTFGFTLKAVGLNKDAAKYAGIDEKMSIILSMTIAGALAGLAGAVIFLTKSGLHMSPTYVLLSQGFDGIAVALLGLSNPIGILFAGLFIGYINQSGFYMQTLSFDKEVITIIISAIIYSSALAMIFKDVLRKWLKRGDNGLSKGGDE